MMIKRHRDITGWESLNHYLGGKPPTSVPGYKSETMQFSECGLPDWSSYRIKLDLCEYYVRTYCRWVLRIPRPPNQWVWLTSTEVVRYLEFREKHSEEYLLYLERRRVRLGPRWHTEWFALRDDERSRILLTEEEFRDSFVPDPGAPLWSNVASNSRGQLGSYLEPIQIRRIPDKPAKCRRSTEPPSVDR
jgi:hypothetical protein